MAATRKTVVDPSLPHSWDLTDWPEQVWPGTSERARWLVRAYRGELIESCALSRAGKRLVILGRGYARWLEKRVANVGSFESNNPNLRQPSAA